MDPPQSLAVYRQRLVGLEPLRGEPLAQHSLEGGVVQVSKRPVQRRHTRPALPPQPQCDANPRLALPAPLADRVQTATPTQQRTDG